MTGVRYQPMGISRYWADGANDFLMAKVVVPLCSLLFLPILCAALPFARSGPSITVDEKRKGLRTVQRLTDEFACDNRSSRDPRPTNYRFQILDEPKRKQEKEKRKPLHSTARVFRSPCFFRPPVVEQAGKRENAGLFRFNVSVQCHLAPGRADTENPPIRSRDCRSDIFHVSDRFRAYQTGNRTFQNGGCGGDRGLQTFSSKHKAILVQATKDPTLSLVWTCETIWEDQRKLLNMKTAKSLRTAAELQHFIEEPKSNLTRIGKLSRSGMNRFGTTMH